MSRRLRILVITQIPLWSIAKNMGGPAISQIFFGFARLGHEVHLVTPRLPYVSQADLPEGVFLHTFKHTFRGVLMDKRKLGWIFDALGWVVFQLKAGRMGRELLRAGDFDVIYGYDVWGIPCARRLADRFDLPMVSRFQGTRMNRWIGARFGDLRFFKYFRAFRTPADLYIMTDDGSRGDELLAQFGVDPSRLRFWRNGVEVRAPAAGQGELKQRFGVGPDEYMLLTVCRLVPEKAVELAVRAMPDVRERFPNSRLVIVGDGPSLADLRDLAADLGVLGNVLFAGALDRRGVSEAFCAADIFLSTHYNTNAGNQTLEAMLLGRPVVAIDYGGTSEVIADGVNGLLVPPDRVRSLGETVAGLLADPERRARLSAEAKAWGAANLVSWRERVEMEINEVGSLAEGWRSRG